MAQNTKVLVIDDNESLRQMITLALTHKGCSVTACKDGKEGVNSFYSGDYDIILTDLQMPKMSGLQVAKTIRRFNPYIPIALISSIASNVANEAQEYGIDILLDKPFTLEQLNCLVTDAVKLKQTRKVL